MRGFVGEAGFLLEREFASFAGEGILHNFGRLGACWNEEVGGVQLTWLGRMLQAILPLQTYGHMLCFVVRRPPV